MNGVGLGYNYFINMLDFFDNLIKTIVAIFTAGIITLGGVFSHKQIETPVQMPPIQVQAVVQQTESSSIEVIASSTKSKTAKEEEKIIQPEVKKSAIPKPPVASDTTAETGQQNISPIVQANATATIILAQPETNPHPRQMQIDSQAMVGILCYYNTKLTNPLNGASAAGGQEMIRGSGVIVNSKGYILTNRHIIQREDSTEILNTSNGGQLQINISYQLDHCEAGTVPAGTHLPTPQEIETINPLIRIPVLGYIVKPVYISSNVGLSNDEKLFADFAILQITGLSQSGPTFGVTSVPSSFPYAKLLAINNYDLTGNRVITYGFPGDVTLGQNDSFQTLTMTGSVGNVTKVEFGNLAYADVPLVVYTNLEIFHGRSGSPLFWRGYVIGLTTFYVEGNRKESGSVASDAIIKALSGTNYLGP
ncbi:MAG: trypsin-like peptidase domain-containing protein [Candidatus Omnitrophica bacterium]|nr:trypsin-like peptidase domain-containing protein [Candidatus Omnitrophota bacterium]